jgi:hypothetical protein
MERLLSPCNLVDMVERKDFVIVVPRRSMVRLDSSLAEARRGKIPLPKYVALT